MRKPPEGPATRGNQAYLTWIKSRPAREACSKAPRAQRQDPMAPPSNAGDFLCCSLLCEKPRHRSGARHCAARHRPLTRESRRPDPVSNAIRRRQQEVNAVRRCPVDRRFEFKAYGRPGLSDGRAIHRNPLANFGERPRTYMFERKRLSADLIARHEYPLREPLPGEALFCWTVLGPISQQVDIPSVNCQRSVRQMRQHVTGKQIAFRSVRIT